MPSKSRTSRVVKKDVDEDEFVMVPSASPPPGKNETVKETAKESAEEYTLHMNCLGCKTLLTHPRSTLSLKCPKCKIIMDLPGAMLGADVVLGRIPSYSNDPEFQEKLRVSEKAGALGVPLPPVAPPGHRLEPVRDAPKPPTFWTLLFKRAENRGALYQLLFTTALMVCVPLGLMGLTFWTIFARMDEADRYMYSGFAGVVGVNIVAIGFGLFAYYDNSPDEPDEAELTEAEREAEREAKRAKWEQWEKEQEATASREDRERLQAIREAHQAKQAEADVDEDDVTGDGATFKNRSKSSRSKSAARDSALGDDTEPAEEPEPSRTKRGRAKKA